MAPSQRLVVARVERQTQAPLTPIECHGERRKRRRNRLLRLHGECNPNRLHLFQFRHAEVKVDLWNGAIRSLRFVDCRWQSDTGGEFTWRHPPPTKRKAELSPAWNFPNQPIYPHGLQRAPKMDIVSFSICSRFNFVLEITCCLTRRI